MRKTILSYALVLLAMFTIVMMVSFAYAFVFHNAGITQAFGGDGGGDGGDGSGGGEPGGGCCGPDSGPSDPPGGPGDQPPTPAPATIQGLRVDQCPVDALITLSGGSNQQSTSQPYSFSGLPPTNSYTVTMTAPSNYTVGYTACTNSITCHNQTPTPGNTVTFSSLPEGGYVDLWFHCTPLPGRIISLVYEDLNGNAKLDAGEKVVQSGSSCKNPVNLNLAGVTVKNTSGATSFATGSNACNESDMAYYDSGYVTPGGYGLTVIPPTGWQRTSPDVSVTVAAGAFGVDSTGNIPLFGIRKQCTPPTITNELIAQGTVDTPFTYKFDISGTEEGITYTATNLPAGLTLSGRTISGTPTTAGTFTVTLKAQNACGTDTKSVGIVISPKVCPVPVITSADTAAATEGTPFTYTITSINNPTSYTASGLPAGLSLNATTGVISGTPTQAGTFTVNLGVSNSCGATPKVLTITVAAKVCPVPAITSSVQAAGTVGTAFSYTITATNNPTAYAALDLPPGLTRNGATISGIPTQAGTFTVTLGANNDCGSAQKIITITISPKVCPAPQITSTLSATGIQGNSFSYTITGTNSPTFSVSGLPTGLSFNQNKITGTLSAAGTFLITITALNECGSDQKTLTLTVESKICPLPQITSTLSVTGTVGDPFTYTVTGSNNSTLTATNVPTGLSFSAATGKITGTPTQSGTFHVTLTATNECGVDTKTLVINIAPKICPIPSISSSLSVTGKVGKPFQYAITASNNPTSYDAINLPPGVTLAGNVLSGTPIEAGTYQVTIKALNSCGEDTKTLVISIAENPKPTCTLTLAKPKLLPGESTTLFWTSQNATAVSFMPAIGSNELAGSVTVTAGSADALYTATFTGEGGSETCQATLQILAPGMCPFTPNDKTIVIDFGPKLLRSDLGPNDAEKTIGGFDIPAGRYEVKVASYDAHSIKNETPDQTQEQWYFLLKDGSSHFLGQTSPTSDLPANQDSLTETVESNFLVQDHTGMVTAVVKHNAYPTSNPNSVVPLCAQFKKQIAQCVPPVLTCDPSAEGKVNQPFHYEIHASNNPDSFEADNLPPGLTLDPATGVISGTPTSAGTFQVVVRALKTVDGVSCPAEKTITITIKPGVCLPGKPVITSELTVHAEQGKAFSYTITATNNPTAFASLDLPPGLTRSGATISGTPITPGTYEVALGASNNCGSDQAKLIIDVCPAICTPGVPNINSATQVSGQVEEGFSYTITATHSPKSFALGDLTALPPGLSFDPDTGEISGTPTVPGTYQLKIIAINDCGQDKAYLKIVIKAGVCKPGVPEITSVASISGRVGDPLSYQIVSSKTATEFGITDSSDLPSGLSLATTTGIISGTPTVAGVFHVSIFAKNQCGIGCKELTITIEAGVCTPPAPVITSTGSASGTVGQNFSYTILASSTVSAFNATGLPAGLSVSTTTGVISGVPTQAGTFTVALSAENACGMDSSTLDITINPGGGGACTPGLPGITSTLNATINVGQQFNYTITSANAATSFDATNLPAGLSVSTTTGEISGTVASAGTYNITISATNNCGADSKILVLTVNNPGGGGGGGGGGGYFAPNVVLLRATTTSPLAAATFVSLTSVPYTGIEDNVKTIGYLSLLLMLSALLAYAIVYRRGRMILPRAGGVVSMHPVAFASEPIPNPLPFEVETVPAEPMLGNNEDMETNIQRAVVYSHTPLTSTATSSSVSSLANNTNAQTETFLGLSSDIAKTISQVRVAAQESKHGLTAPLSQTVSANDEPASVDQHMATFIADIARTNETLLSEDSYSLIVSAAEGKSENAKKILEQIIAVGRELYPAAEQSFLTLSREKVKNILFSTYLTMIPIVIRWMVVGERTKAFAFLRLLNHQGHSVSEFLRACAYELDRVYRFRAERIPGADEYAVEVTAPWSRVTMEAVITALVSAADENYSSSYTSAKLALSKVFDLADVAKNDQTQANLRLKQLV